MTDDLNRRGRLRLLDTGAPPRPQPTTSDDVTRDLHSGEDAPEGTVIGGLDQRFLDHGEIARGGMGIVHRVVEHSLNRVVALKVLKAEKAQQRGARERFIAEAQITGQLEHPYIVPVYELGVDDDGRTFFTMKLLEGRTLEKVIEDRRPAVDDSALRDAVDVLLKVADALSFAHSRGVIHRDVKPSNIMVGDHGEVTLMDWGIARVPEPAARPVTQPGEKRTTSLTSFAPERMGTVLGTYAYMSPEQARGAVDQMTPRTDVFGLGAVLFRVVSGRAPIEGVNQLDALARAAQGQITDVHNAVAGRLRQALLEVSLQAMRKDPAERFSSVGALRKAIEGVLRGGQRFPMIRFPAGTRILEEGTLGAEAYIIRSGECVVYRTIDGQRVGLQRLTTGDVFGETAIFTGRPRNASVEAATDIELYVVAGRILEHELGLDTWLGEFVRSLGERFTAQVNRAAVLEAELRRGAVLRTAAMALLAARDSPVSLATVARDADVDVARARDVLSADPGFVVAGDAVRRR
jgi:CRP-like cAMP-binding protein/tRNA A-37 threonylcarbamoyl transferase component Bud32